MLQAFTQEYLRTHTVRYLETDAGLRLSPAYDMNPDPYADGLKLNISDVDNAQDLDLALEVADYFRVNGKRARTIAEEVVAVAKGWRSLAGSLRISSDEIERMEPAFRVSDASS